jgi:fibronectin type 3 domain-containing protein
VAIGSYFLTATVTYQNGWTTQSSQVHVTVTPAVPTGLMGTPDNNQVTLNWAAASGAASYNVKRSTVNGGPYTTIGTSTGTSYPDTTAANGNIYYYVVSAVSSDGCESVNSSQAGPYAPGVLTLTYNSTVHTLSWSWNGATPTIWWLENKPPADVPWTIVMPISPSTTSIPTEGLHDLYRVYGGDWSCNPITPYSGIVAFNADDPTVSISSPANNTKFVGPANIPITVTPSDTCNGAVVNIYQGGSLLQTISSAPYTYTWPNVAIGSYFLTATVTYQNGWTTQSSQVHVTVTPAVPTGLTGTPDNNQVTLNWAAASGAASYNVKRSTVNGGSYTTIGTSTGTSYTDTTAANGNIYYYVVSAVSSGGIESANSSQAGPYAPGVLTLTYDSTAHTLSWSWNGATPTIWWLQNKPPADVPWTILMPISPSTTSIPTEGLNDLYRVYGGDWSCNPITPYSGTVAFGDSPTVSISSPANNSSYTAPASITINANPSDSNNGAAVTFYQGSSPSGGSPIATITSAPYTCTWQNVSAGGYFLSATVTYANGWTTARSGAVHISVH